MTADGKRRTVPPTTALERTLLDIWQDVLGAEAGAVGVDDDFFDLGGDSVLAAEVFERVEAALGVRLPLRAAAEHATVAEMAAWIASEVPADAPGRTVVRLSRTTHAPAFFCVHGMGGHVLVFGGLARRLEDLVGFYAFESVGRNDAARADTTMAAMAERYLGDLARVQPEGPYLLGGYSMGGVVALEMAHRLVADGHDVRLVALLDSDLRPPPSDVLRGRVVEFVSRALGVDDPPVCRPYEELDDAAEEVCRRVAERRGRSPVGPADVARFAEIYLTNARALDGYTPPAYQGDVVLFYTAEGPNSHVADADPAAAASALGWADVVDGGRFRSVRVPGDHWTMFTTNVDVLAGGLRAAVERALVPHHVQG